MAGYTQFEEQFLVGCVQIAEEAQKDIVNVDMVLKRFNLNPPDYWIDRAVVGFYESQFTRHTPWVGRYENRNIQLSAKGVKEAEKLLRFGTEFPSNLFNQKSDIVEKDLFKAKIISISSEIGNIEEKLNDNFISVTLGDQKEVILSDIEASKKLLGNNKFRLSSLKSLILEPMKFLLEKFSGTAISEVAKRVIELLMDLK